MDVGGEACQEMFLRRTSNTELLQLTAPNLNHLIRKPGYDSRSHLVQEGSAEEQRTSNDFPISA